MGRAKALLPTGVVHETFISRIVMQLRAGGVDDIVVVVGKDGPAEHGHAIELALASLEPRPRTAVNPHPDAGQLSSLLIGLAAVAHPGISGVMVTLVDVPLIDSDTVRRLRLEHARSSAPIVRPVKEGRHGHPVIFDRSVFHELRGADPALGAKQVVRAHRDREVEVPVEADGPFVDVDTPAAYQRVFGRSLTTVE